MRHKHGIRGGNPNAAASVRDAYGFEVKKDMLSLYHKYAPIWEKEEVERSERWDAFLAHFETMYQKTEPDREERGGPLQQLEQACQGWAPEDRGASKELNDWQHQLRSLVQAGIPMTLRGKMWRTFLGLEAVKQEGYYEQLVHQALGSKYSKRKDKVAAEDQADLAHTTASMDDAANSPEHASHLAQPSNSMALSVAAIAANIDAELDSLAAACPAAAAPSESSMQAPDTPQPPSSGGMGTSTSAELGSTMLLMSSQTLAALPTPTHPSAIPAATAQALNNELGRSLLQVPLDPEEAAAASPHSERLTSAYSEGGSSELSKVGADWHPSSRDWNLQIEKDLHRTFPGHPVMDGTGRSALRRILAAYARRNPSVGYCQGMNFIAGCLLLFMDEEDTFWCLAIIVEELLPGYYSMAMVEPQVDQLVFKELVDVRFPMLSAHLEGHGVNVSSVSTNWFLCIFVNSLPLESCLRVWDIFFLECCSSVLFRVALALVDIYFKALVSTTDSVDAFSLLQNMAPMSYDSSRLIDVACISFSTTDHAHLAALQARHRQTVLAQFASHGREVDEEGWNSSGADSEGVQRSAHSTPHAGAQPSGPFGPSARPAAQAKEELQVTSRSRSAFIPRRLKQVKVVSRPLAGSPGNSPQADVEGNSPSSQGHPSAAGSPFSPASSPEWHSTPRWPQYANFGAHSTRPVQPSTLSHVTSASQGMPLDDTASQDNQGVDEASGQAGMGEEEYQAAVAETAELAAHLPRIGVVGRRPPQGPSMPQRLFNHFRSPEAVLGEQLRSALPRSSSGMEESPPPGDSSAEAEPADQPSVTGRMLPPAGTPTPSPSPAYHAAAGLHPAAWGIQRSQEVFQPASPAHPPAPPSTPQVASSSDPIPTSVPWQNEAPHRPGDDRRADWPAGPADDTTESVEAPALSRQACDAQLSTSFPPRLPGLLTSHDRSGSEELTLQETESSRASSRIPAHSVLSRMLQEGSSHGAGAEEDQAAAWLPPDMLQQGGNSPDSAAVQQLLHVVEGLEEELFSSEARRNDAEVQAEGLEASVQELQARLQRAQEDLALKRQTVEGLTHKFDRGAVVLGESDAKLADTQVALAAAKAQLAVHDKHLASQDAAIKSLVRKQGQHEGLGASFLKSLHTRFRFPAKNDKISSADMDDDGANDAKEAS